MVRIGALQNEIQRDGASHFYLVSLSRCCISFFLFKFIR